MRKTSARENFIKLELRLTWSSFLSMSTRVSLSTVELTVPMRGSVTDGSIWWLWLAVAWWCAKRLPRLAAEMFLGKWLTCSFSSLGWLWGAGKGRERLSKRKRGRDQAWSHLLAGSVQKRQEKKLFWSCKCRLIIGFGNFADFSMATSAPDIWWGCLESVFSHSITNINNQHAFSNKFRFVFK